MQSYADKLRTYARDPSQMILPLYEAKALFANIDNIVSGSAAFYVDLEELCHAGEAESRIGDVCLKHVGHLSRVQAKMLRNRRSSRSSVLSSRTECI